MIGLCLALVACSNAPSPTPPSSSPSSPQTPSADGSAGAGVTTRAPQPGALKDLAVRLVTVARGFDRPLFVTNAQDDSGRLFVVEQTGRIRVVRDGKVSSRPFLDVSDRISAGGERGLLGLAFAPDYKTSGRFYVNYTDRNGDTEIDRFVAEDPSSDSPRLKSPTAVFRHSQPYPNHNGGCLMFAPDGAMWVGMGDGGSAGDPGNRAQNPRSRLGKLLSLDVSGDATAKVTMVALGLRNPWRFAFDAKTRDVWIADVGQNAWEEIDLVPYDKIRGANFGWNRWEGNHAYPPGSKRSRDNFVFPVIEYSHDEGESVSGGFVYRGRQYPGLDGVYFYGDFVSGWIAAARKTSGGRVENRKILPDPGVAPSSFGVGEDGELYVCDYNGRVLKVTSR